MGHNLSMQQPTTTNICAGDAWSKPAFCRSQNDKNEIQFFYALFILPIFIAAWIYVRRRGI
jgi:hypothetical protein